MVKHCLSCLTFIINCLNRIGLSISCLITNVFRFCSCFVHALFMFMAPLGAISRQDRKGSMTCWRVFFFLVRNAFSWKLLYKSSASLQKYILTDRLKARHWCLKENRNGFPETKLGFYKSYPSNVNLQMLICNPYYEHSQLH